MSDDAIPAATLILVRERAGAPPEFLMVERAPGMAFAGGALVFPGGRVDAEDEAAAEHLETRHGSAAVAAIRETIEETAVPAGLAPVPSPDEARALQAGLGSGGGLSELLEQHGLDLRVEDLTPMARWVPRFHAKRRFDTLFFVARASAGDWTPNVLEGECTSALWISAVEVLERDRRNEVQLIFPTRRTLERLAQHATYDEIVADALAHAIQPISPWVEELGDERFITIPAGIGFPVVREKLEGLWRG
jgi:8-oxo-dGTP pyrophosphatase MutT (NUDIX family)